MAAHRLVVGLVVVAGLAYGAGRYGVGAPSTSEGAQPDAKKQPEKKPDAKAPTPGAQPGGEKMSPEIEAMMKAGTPGENHRVLDALVGEFTGSVKMWMKADGAPMESTGTVTRKWIMDRHFVDEEVEAAGMGGPASPPFHGRGTMGYNNLDKVYEFAWVDNSTTAIMFETGTYDAAKKIMSTRGKHTDPVTGKPQATRGEMNLSDPNKQTFVGYCTGADGKEFKCFEGTFERKAKK